jgi:RNA polymerase sigma factor for flagellar operon FliA
MGTLAAVKPAAPPAVRAEVDARNEVLVRCMPLVRYVARRVGASYGLPAGVEIADLVSYGLFGLVEAYERFDASRGVKFETFAIPRIRGAIVDELRHMDWVPRNVRSRARKMSDAAAVLTAQLGRAPTREEMADRLGLEELDGFERRGTPATLLALEDIVGQDGAGLDSMAVADTLVDRSVAEPGYALEESELRAALLKAMDDISERDRLILTLYYFESVPLGVVARLLGVTESRVSQLHTRALHAMRVRLAS